jgi:cytoskeletal protein RodZ
MSLGEYLRQEREKRGITIEQVASATKIGVKTLHALEGDQYAELPAKPFVRGFVNSYARFIGLDSKEILTRFGDFIDAKAHDRPNREGGHSGYAFEKREGDQSRTVLWIVMGSFVVAGGLAAVLIKKPLGHKHHGAQAEKLRAAYGVAPSPVPSAVATPAAQPSASPQPSPSPSASPSAAPVTAAVPTEAPAPTPSPAPSPAPAPTQAPTPSPAPSTPTAAADEGPSEDDPLNSGIKLKPSEIKHRVIFRAVESAWVRYQCDNRPVTQFVFRTGKVLVLRARESIKFQVSPPKALTFSYNNGGYKPLVGDRQLVTRQNDATLFFPPKLADSIEKPFPEEKPLSSRAVPPPRPTPSLSPTSQ